MITFLFTGFEWNNERNDEFPEISLRVSIAKMQSRSYYQNGTVSRFNRERRCLFEHQRIY